MNDPWYFAYGSNLDRGQKKERTGKIREEQRARLKGYRIAFNKKGSDGTGKANVCPDRKGSVWGVVYRCSPMALEEMDRHEGVSGGHYVRKMVRVRVDSGVELEAVTYVAGEGFIGESLEPSREYLDSILRGARQHHLPQEYISRVKALGKRKDV